MKKLLMIIPLVLVLCFTFSCQQGEEVAEEPAVDVEADIDAIKTLNEEFDVTHSAGDIEGIMALYADSPVMITPNGPALIGREAIRNRFQKEFDRDTEELKGVIVDVHVSCDLGFTWGTWTSIKTPKAGGESRKFSGNQAFILQRQPDGSWKIICETWSEDSLIYPPPKKK